jgi:hypothetical protein
VSKLTSMIISSSTSGTSSLCTAAFLPAFAAARAHRHGDLVRRAAGGLGRNRSVDHRAAQRGDERVIGQVGHVGGYTARSALAEARPRDSDEPGGIIGERDPQAKPRLRLRAARMSGSKRSTEAVCSVAVAKQISAHRYKDIGVGLSQVTLAQRALHGAFSAITTASGASAWRICLPITAARRSVVGGSRVPAQANEWDRARSGREGCAFALHRTSSGHQQHRLSTLDWNSTHGVPSRTPSRCRREWNVVRASRECDHPDSAARRGRSRQTRERSELLHLVSRRAAL